MKVAVIVCDHGLGHLRRCALMALDLAAMGHIVEIFAPRGHFDRLKRAMPATASLEVIDFSTNTNPSDIRSSASRSTSWLKKLPNLSEYETVYSDNLPEILDVRGDAILCAQFFWHEVIQGADIGYRDYCESLLEYHRPTVMGCSLFAMDSVQRLPGFVPVGLYKNPSLIRLLQTKDREESKDLLVTGGTTEAVRSKLRGILEGYEKSRPEGIDKIHADRELISALSPEYIVPASFSDEMYLGLSSAICRPGLGVLTDLLTIGIKPYLVFEDGNLEMLHNSHVLESNGLSSNRYPR